jgi:gliding motility-associated-like protein
LYPVKIIELGWLVKLGLLSVCLFIFSRISGQVDCDFTVEVSIAKISDCESNGIIKAVLTGTNVDEKIIQISDARYSIESIVSGGYSTIFDANEGIIQAVPPGTYIIKAEAYCTEKETRIIRSSEQITMTGTYPGFDQKQMEINTAGIKKSLECSSTGSIPVQLGSGRTPYTVRISKAPEEHPELVNTVYNRSDAGEWTIENLPWGEYELALSDACGYTVYRQPKIDRIDHKYEITKIEPARICSNEGKIHLSLIDGTPPYTITFIDDVPDNYTGPSTLTVEHDGNFVIDKLPAGNYKFTVNDICHPEEFTETVNTIFPQYNAISEPTLMCKNDGKIKFSLQKGTPPYDVILTGAPAAYTAMQINDAILENVDDGDYTINDLPEGEYKFTVYDDCYQDELTVTVKKIMPEYKVTGTEPSPICSQDGKIHLSLQNGTFPYNITMLEYPPEYTPPPEGLTVEKSGDYDITGLPVGKYGFSVEDLCYSETLQAEVSESKFTPTAEQIDLAAPCKSDGRIKFTFNGGMAPYTVKCISYSGDPEGVCSSEDLTVSDKEIKEITVGGFLWGEYEFMITDGCNSEFPVKVKIEIVDDLNLEIGSIKDVKTCNDNDGEVTITVTGGAMPYNDVLLLNETTGVSYTAPAKSPYKYTGLAPGKYKFEVEDGCENIESEYFEIKRNLLDAKVGKVITSFGCGASGEIVVEIVQGEPDYTLTLLKDGDIIDVLGPSAEKEFTFQGLSPGIYDIYVTDACEDIVTLKNVTIDEFEYGDSEMTEGGIGYADLYDNEFYPVNSTDCKDGMIKRKVNSNSDFYKYWKDHPEKFEVVFVRSDDFSNPSDWQWKDVIDENIISFDVKYCEARDNEVSYTAYIRMKQPEDEATPYCSDILMDVIKFAPPDPASFTVAPLIETCAKVKWSITNTATFICLPYTITVTNTATDVSETIGSYSDLNPVETDFMPHGTYRIEIKDNGDCVFYDDVVTSTPIDPDEVFPFSVNSKNIYCADAEWEITPNPEMTDDHIAFPYYITFTDIDGSNNYSKTFGPYYDLNTVTTTAIPHGTYQVEIEDEDGCVFFIDTRTSGIPPPTEEMPLDVVPENFICDSYSIHFNYGYDCYNYSWVLMEAEKTEESEEIYSVIVEGDINNKSDYDNLQKRTKTGLQYKTKYKLCILYGDEEEKDIVVCKEFSYTGRPDPEPYLLDFIAEYCLPDTAKGAIRLYRNIDFEKGAIIKFVDGPASLPDSTYIVPNQDGIREYYPFSNNLTQKENVYLEEGHYRFAILDSCGYSDTIHIDYKHSTVIDFGYDRTPGCSGTDITPHGSIYLGDEKIQSYFRITEQPPQTSISQIIAEGSSDVFEISFSGHYVMEIGTYNGEGGSFCPFSNVGFDFIKENVSLDADFTLTYICTDGDGYIRVRRKGGVGPFTYSLFDKDQFIESNDTGEFHYGTYGESYTIRIRDVGCVIEFPATVYMLDLSKSRIINDDIKLCPGEEIQLTCLSIGNYSGYNWTGPDEWTSTLQNPSIPDATLEMDGDEYSITVRPEGCSSDITQTVKVNVICPDPLPDTTIYYCKDDVAVPLTATPKAGNYLKWYDTDIIYVETPPVPPTDKPDTLDYFVSQVNSIYGCEGEKSTVRVIIQDFPDMVVYAYADDICKDSLPVVIIPETYIYPDYVYRIFNQSGDRTGIDTARSDTPLEIQSSESMATSGFLYVEVETDHRCVSTERLGVPINVTHPALPVVHDTLYCLNETEVVPLKADSTEGNRLQWYDTDAVTPLLSAPFPPTDVAGKFSYWVAQVDILLGCVGDKAELTVTIQDLPDILLIKASAPDICRRTAPVVIVENTYDLYTYTLFNKNNDTLDTKVSGGTPLELHSPDYILSQRDTLYVEIQNQHKCTSKDRAIVPVHVITPDTPQVFDTLYCLNATATSLRAIPSSEYDIQWYELDGNPVTSAPIPPTDKLDTLYYNVSQKHNILHCESDTLQIQIVIEALPDTVAANSPPICPGQHPVINIPETKQEYSYSVYSGSGTFLASKSGNGDSINIVLPNSVYESEDFFVETLNANNCASDSRTKTRTEVINYMYLLPDEIPPYQRGKPYSVQLESNAVAPYEYSTIDMLPFGFSLSISGLITGTPPVNGLLEPSPLRVKVVDVNGCYAEQNYVLESNIFIPQAFSPNGDGKNDIFMKGRRLVIFDRLGLKIFEGNDGWDGTRFDGTPAPPDTYFYLIYYEDEKLMTQGRKKGYITLIRRQ